MAKKPKLTPVTIATTGDVPLEGPAAELYATISKRWELTPCHERILRLAAEAIQVATRCERIVMEQGDTVISRGGITKHPAAAMAHDNRVFAANALQKLALALD